LGATLAGAVVENSGGVIATANDSTGSKSLVFRVDPRTGKRTVLSDDSNTAQGPSFGALYTSPSCTMTQAFMCRRQIRSGARLARRSDRPIRKTICFRDYRPACLTRGRPVLRIASPLCLRWGRAGMCRTLFGRDSSDRNRPVPFVRHCQPIVTRATGRHSEAAIALQSMRRSATGRFHPLTRMAAVVRPCCATNDWSGSLNSH
jgi:hypothetical protein